METHDQPPLPPAAQGPSADNTWAVIMHLSGFSGCVIPSGHLLGPLVLWLIKRTDSPVLDRTGKEVLNFQISYTIYAIAASALMLVLVGFLLLPVVLIAWVVLIIVAAVKTSNGEDYRYPFTIRLL